PAAAGAGGARGVGSHRGARRGGQRRIPHHRGAWAACRSSLREQSTSRQRAARQPAGCQRHHRQHGPRQRAFDRGNRSQVFAGGREHGGRGVHARVSHQPGAVRSGPRGLERRREAEPRGVEPRRGDCEPQSLRAGDPRARMKLSLGFSPCPNDCFMFDAIVNRRIDLDGLQFAERLADVEALNKSAFAGEADVTKLSYHAYAYCADKYVLLDAGSALGRNCGPLVISKRAISRDEVAAGALRIAIPGKYTTANFLCGLAFPKAQQKTELVFSEIEPALLRGEFDCGVIIHENRFTYEAKGLKKIVDLGEFWETETGAPIPLGGIVINRSLPDDVKQRVNRVLRRSVEYAFANRTVSLPYIRAHAQELSDEVMYQHIDLYVNDYSIDLGAEGRRAVELLFESARAAGIVPIVSADVFLPNVTTS